MRPGPEQAPASRQRPDADGPVLRPSRQSRSVWGDVHSEHPALVALALHHLLAVLCVPHRRLPPVRPSYHPPPVARHRDVVDVAPRIHRRPHLLAVFHSPMPNLPFSATAHNVLAVSEEGNRIYVMSTTDFDWICFVFLNGGTVVTGL